MIRLLKIEYIIVLFMFLIFVDTLDTAIKYGYDNLCE